MTLIERCGLATLTVLMVTAFVEPSISTAESTKLCTSDGCGTHVLHIHEATLSNKKIKIIVPIGHILCDTLKLITITSSGGLAAPLQGEGNLTYSNCGSCTVEEVGGGTAMEVLKLGHETADVTEEFEIHVNCSGLNCYYNGEGLLGTAKGPLLSSETNGEVSIVEQVLNKVKGLFCPTTSKLEIVTTPLSATYIGS